MNLSVLAHLVSYVVSEGVTFFLLQKRGSDACPLGQ